MAYELTLTQKLNVNDTVFSLEQFLRSPGKYMPLFNSVLSTSTLNREVDECDLSYYCRLFATAFYKKRFGIDIPSASTINRTARSERHVLTDEASKILDAFGISVIKHNAKISKVLFKSSGTEYKMQNDNIDLLLESIKNKTKLTRRKKAVKIGVELEFIGDYNVIEFNEAMTALVGADRYAPLLRYNHNDGTKWVLGTDGSLRWQGRNLRGYEMTSPVLDPSSKKDMAELRNVIELIKTKLNGETNRSCGTHVHMSFDCECSSERMCRYFAKSYHNNEESCFDKLVPKSRVNSRWCRSSNWQVIGGRYYKLNLCNTARGSQSMHLEFRQLDGTLDYNKIVAWVKLQKLFVELTCKNYNKDIATAEATVPSFTVNEVIFDKSFNQQEVEALLTMGKILA
jgi:hypothetical protein